jgi:hypothetical protein
MDNAQASISTPRRTRVGEDAISDDCMVVQRLTRPELFPPIRASISARVL